MKLSVIIIDDDSMSAYLTKEILLEYNDEIEFMCFSDPEDFLSIAEQINQSAIILMDLNMPQKKGWDVIEEIRNNNFSFPIIVLTASLFQEDAIKAHNFGVGFLNKPIEISAFQNEIRSFMNSN